MAFFQSLRRPALRPCRLALPRTCIVWTAATLTWKTASTARRQRGDERLAALLLRHLRAVAVRLGTERAAAARHERGRVRALARVARALLLERLLAAAGDEPLALHHRRALALVAEVALDRQ